MSRKPPNINVDLRAGVPSGYIVGRVDKGTGRGQLLSIAQLRQMITPGVAIAQNPTTLNLTQNHIYVGNASNIATDVAMSGDVTIVAAGTTTIANGAVTEGKQALADVTTLDVSTTKHGYVPKAPNDTSKFLRGDGTWAAVAGGGGGSVDASPFSDDSIVKPAAADFTIADDTSTNHGTGAKSNLSTRGVLLTHTQAGTPTSSQTLFYQAAVGNTLGTLIAYVQPNLFTASGSAWFFGLAVRDNAGKIDAFGIRNSGSLGGFVRFQYTNISTLSSTPGATTHGVPINNRPIWLKLAKVSTNFEFSASFDGETYLLITTVSATSFVGATLNDVGFFIVNNLGVANSVFGFDCYSFFKS